ncbi:uncharacterized protein BT62DRAFT_922063 [Guyanagaster necrorhizus]|uniref:Uncharacterized protein n=1 Tax=Guyanagaster necrorhizus TaxID=856835 RepID=A0A9P8APF4_9AGAR|nr:uncharacterized protein BT62DRAFT_922063 [Guyanagaster necrorhizus MCA 3950]KAG7443283.1 hypothetical protein BT62DRAFT_922063 [Guyanagaster necrorhizus MCA 3950]
MPRLNEKAASHFESFSDAKKLEHFFLRLEDLFDKCVVDDNEEKKKAVISYTDIKTEHQWKVLLSFAAGEKYDDFKSEDSDRDAILELKRLVHHYDIVQINDKKEHGVKQEEIESVLAVIKDFMEQQTSISTARRWLIEEHDYQMRERYPKILEGTGKLQSQNIVINAIDTSGLFYVSEGYSMLLQEK